MRVSKAGSKGGCAFWRSPRQLALEDAPRDTGVSHLVQFCAYNFDSVWQKRADTRRACVFRNFGPSRAFTFVTFEMI